MEIFPLKTGNFVKVEDGKFSDWFVVTYPYGEGGEEIFSACGLGKSDSFPVLSSQIIEKRQFTSLLAEFHKKDFLFWFSKNGRLFVSYPIFNLLDGIAYATGTNVYYRYEIVRGMHGNILFKDDATCAFTYQFDGFTLFERNSTIKVPTENKETKNFFPSIRSHLKDIILPQLNKMEFPLSDLEEHEFNPEGKENEVNNDFSAVYYTIK